MWAGGTIAQATMVQRSALMRLDGGEVSTQRSGALRNFYFVACFFGQKALWVGI